MNSLYFNISLVSLITHHYTPSPLFTNIKSNLYFKDIAIDRSFSPFTYNNRYTKIRKSNFLNFIDAVINIENNAFNFTGYFPSELNINGIQGAINIFDSLFLNITGRAVIHNNVDYTSIFILNSQFINIQSTESAINLQLGASLFVNSVCFFAFQGTNSVFNIKVFLENEVQLNYSSFLEISTQNHLLHCSNCSFYMNNDNFTSNSQGSGPLMIFSSMNYFSAIYLNLMNSITSGGFLFPDLIDLANFTMINVNNLGKTNRISYIFELKKGSIYVYYSSFNINANSKLINVNTSTAFFYRCNASVEYNQENRPLMLWTIACLQTLPAGDFIPANPNLFASLLYCENGSFPDPEFIQPILINEEKSGINRNQQKGATEVLGIILFCVLGVSVIALSLWLILYFVVYKNPLKEFENDDQTARWKQRWDWILINTNKAAIEHRECSDMELDPIELSEDAIKRRHKELYNDVSQSQFSESQKLVSGSLAEDSQKQAKKAKKSKKQNQNKEEDQLSLDDIDKISLNEKTDSQKSATDKDDGHKTQNVSKTVAFKKNLYKNPKNQAAGGDDDVVEDDESSKKKKSKIFKAHFMSSDENNKGDDDNDDDDKIEGGVISESDDLAADNDKIINDLEKTKSTWNRFQKTGFDKSLGVVDESSDSSFGLKNTKINLVLPKQKEENIDSDTIWSDDKGDKDDDDDDDDDDIWSENGDDEGDNEDNSYFD